MKRPIPHLPFAFLATLLALLLAASSSAQSPGAVAGMGPVADQEKAIWDALQAGKWDTAASYMAPNFVYVGQQIGDRTQSMEGMKSCKLSSYTFHDPQTRQIAPDILLLTYVANVDTVCGTEPYKGDVNCSSLWQRKNGKWMGVSHTESVAAPKP